MWCEKLGSTEDFVPFAIGFYFQVSPECERGFFLKLCLARSGGVEQSKERFGTVKYSAVE